MADFNYEELDELEDLRLELEADDGEKISCDLLCIFEYNKKDYAAFTEADNEDEEQEVFFFEVLQEQGKKNDEVELGFEIVDDDDLQEDLLEVLQQVIDEASEERDDAVIEIPESSDAEEDEDDEEDSKWDEFIKKKL